MSEKEKLTTVAYNAELSEKFSQTCRAIGITKRDFLESIIDQYSRTLDDPRRPIKENLVKRLSSIENKIISFIKKQEQTYLSDIQEDIQLTAKQMHVLSKAVADNFQDEKQSRGVLSKELTMKIDYSIQSHMGSLKDEIARMQKNSEKEMHNLQVIESTLAKIDAIFYAIKPLRKISPEEVLKELKEIYNELKPYKA